MTIKVENGDICPLMGKTCIGLQCAWFTKVQGTNPQSGKQIEEWACAVAWLPMLLIENSQNTRMSGAAVESFRNELCTRIGMPIEVPRDTLNSIDTLKTVNETTLLEE